MTTVLTIFQRFGTTFLRFSKIFRKLYRRPDKHFRRFPKTTEDPKMFRSHTNKLKLKRPKRKKNVFNSYIFTCDDTCFTQALGKQGKILDVYRDGDVRVMVGTKLWRFNPAALATVCRGETSQSGKKLM